MGQQHRQEDDGAQAEAAALAKHQHAAIASPDPNLGPNGNGSAAAAAFAVSNPNPNPNPNPSYGGGAASASSRPVSGVSIAKLKRTELSLRISTFLASLAAFLFFITDKQTNTFRLYTTDIVQEALYTDAKALVYAVIVLGIAAVYSVLQLVKVVIIDYSSIAPESSFAWTVFLCDQVLAYVILSASSASAQVAWLSEQGNSGYGWMKICNLYGKFCKQVGAGLIAAFLAFLGLLFSSGISSFILFAADPQD